MRGIRRILAATIVVLATGCGGAAEQSAETHQGLSRIATMKCGLNKIGVYDDIGGMQCVCNEGFSENSFGGCTNLWGVVIHSTDLDQDNESRIKTGSHQRRLSFGVPVPRGNYPATFYAPRCRIRDPQTNTLYPADCQAMAKWYSPKGTASFKWIRATFVSPFFSQGTKPLQVVFYKSTAPRSLGSKALAKLVTVKADNLLVNNGALRFRIEKASALIREVRFSNAAANAIPLPLESYLSLTDDKGTLFSGELDAKEPWIIEENGLYAATIRLKGNYVNNDGLVYGKVGKKTFNRFVMRIHLSRNLSSFDIEHTVEISSSETQTRSIGSMTVDFRGANPKSPIHYDSVSMPGFSNGSLTANAFAPIERVASVVFRDKTDSVSETPNNNLRKEMGQSTGYMQLHTPTYDVGVALRKPSFEFPKTIDLRRTQNDGDILSVDLWPSKRGAEDLLKAWPAQPGPLDLKNPYLDYTDISGYYCVDVSDNPGTIYNLGGGPGAEVCRQWTGQSEPGQGEVIHWLGIDKSLPILLGNFRGDFDAFLTSCGTEPHEACNSERRFVFDNTAIVQGTSRGMAKTHYLTVFAEPTKKLTKAEKLAPKRVATIANLLDHEPYMRVDPQAIRASGAFGNYYLGTDGDAAFDDIETAVGETLDRGVAEDEEHRVYGMLRYGNEYNNHGHSSAPTKLQLRHPEHDLLSSKGLFNQEAHDILYSAWWLYLRASTPKARKAWNYAQKKCRNLIDLSTVWSNKQPHKIGWQGRHSLLPLSDPHTTHTVTAGVQLCHLLTGNRRARKAVANAAKAAALDYYAPNPPERPYGIFTKYHEHVEGKENDFGGTIRTHSAMWLALMTAYELNPDPQLAVIIHGFKETLVAALNLPGSRGGLQTNLWSKNGELSMSGEWGGYQMSLYLALDYFDRLFPEEASQPNYRDAMTGLAKERLENWISGPVQQSMVYRFLTKAYYATGDAYYLSLYPALKRLIASQTPEGGSPQFTSDKVARYYLPRTVGSYLNAIRDYRGVLGEQGQNLSESQLVEQLLRLNHEHAVRYSTPDEVVEVGYIDGPLNLFVDETTDRYFELNYQLAFLTKNGGGGMIKVLAPDGTIAFCREYCNSRHAVAGSPNTYAKDVRCTQAPQADHCPTPDSNRVTVQCDMNNRNELFYVGGRATKDHCSLKFKPDGQAGRYQIVIDTLPEVPNVANLPFSKTTNLLWGIQSDLASQRSPFIGGVGYDLAGGAIRLRSPKGHLYVHRQDGAPIPFTLKSPNLLAGLYSEDANGGPGQGATLYKEQFGWEGPQAAYVVGHGDDVTGFWVSNGPYFGSSNAEHRVAELKAGPGILPPGLATLWLNGRPYLNTLVDAEADMEELAAPLDPANPFVGWNGLQGECTERDDDPDETCLASNALHHELVGGVTVDSQTPMEGSHSMRINVPWFTAVNALSAARANEHYVFRVLTRSTHHYKCFLEYCGRRLRYIPLSPADGTPTLLESTPQSCAFDAAAFRFRSASQAPEELSCSIDALEIFRVQP